MFSLLLQAAAAGACPNPAPLPPSLLGWEKPRELAGGADLAVGSAASLKLRPQSEVTFVVPSPQAKKAETFAGQYAFRITQAGTYRVAAGSGLWIDVVRSGKAIASSAHGHGPNCSGVRKMVDFALVPGRYILQLSGSATPAARVMVVPTG